MEKDIRDIDSLSPRMQEAMKLAREHTRGWEVNKLGYIKGMLDGVEWADENPSDETIQRVFDLSLKCIAASKDEPYGVEYIKKYWKKEMTIKEAIEILNDHNIWRRGEAPYDKAGVKPKYTPKEVGEAIDIALKCMSKTSTTVIEPRAWACKIKDCNDRH